MEQRMNLIGSGGSDRWSDTWKSALTAASQNIVRSVDGSYLNALVRGMRVSSVVCSLHLSTPTSLLMGKDFSGFFRPITDSAVKNFLSTLGCVCQQRRHNKVLLVYQLVRNTHILKQLCEINNLFLGSRDIWNFIKLEAILDTYRRDYVLTNSNSKEIEHLF